MAQGAPLRALALAKQGLMEQRADFFAAWLDVGRGEAEPVLVADQWSKFSCEVLIEWLMSWVIDLLRLGAAPNCRTLDNPDLSEDLQAMAKQLELKDMFGFLDLLNTTKRGLPGQINRQLALEELLIYWFQVPRILK